MKFTTLYEHSGKVMLTLFLLLVLCGAGCADMYLNNRVLYSKLTLKTKEARKDSIVAKQSSIMVNNLVHPEAVIPDSSGEYVYFKVKKTEPSDKPFPASPAEVRTDTVNEYTAEYVERDQKNSRIISQQNEVIARQRADLDAVSHTLDSVENSPFQFADKYLSIQQIKRAKEGVKTDSVNRRYTAVLYPDISLDKHRYIGLAHWDTVPPKHGSNYGEVKLISPDTSLVFMPNNKSYNLYLYNQTFAGAGQITMNYNPAVHAWQVGFGMRFYYRGLNMYIPYYFNLSTGKLNKTISFSFSKTLFRF